MCLLMGQSAKCGRFRQDLAGVGVQYPPKSLGQFLKIWGRVIHFGADIATKIYIYIYSNFGADIATKYIYIYNMALPVLRLPQTREAAPNGAACCPFGAGFGLPQLSCQRSCHALHTG